MNTRSVSELSANQPVPRHVAIIMDGNGRWAKSRGLPRHAGHHAGVRSVREVVEACAKRDVEVLTLFAFSSENWKRPKEEVSRLMQLFLDALDREIASLHKNSIRVRFVGNMQELNTALRARMQAAETLTAANQRLSLVIAVAYGGRWDIAQAASSLAQDCVSGLLKAEDINEDKLAERMALAGLPEPDLFIRTGGDQRISNFLLWNLAYTELYFCEALWPDFDEAQLEAALRHFAGRQRRFGLTPEQSAEASR